jgi:hypothetical protein
MLAIGAGAGDSRASSGLSELVRGRGAGAAAGACASAAGFDAGEAEGGG